MAKQTTSKTRNSNTATQQEHPHITLNETQLQHYTEGEGLLLKAPNGQVLRFLHEVDDDNMQRINNMSDAQDLLAFLRDALAGRDGGLELTPQGVVGLGHVIDKMGELLV